MKMSRDEFDLATFPKTKALLKETLTVFAIAIKSTFQPQVDSTHVYKDPQRERISRGASPEVEAINREYDKKGVPLSVPAADALDKRREIQEFPKAQGLIFRLGTEVTRFGKQVRVEDKISKAFALENQELIRHFSRKELTDENLEECTRLRTKALAGEFAHAMCSVALAAVEPFNSVKSDFDTGVSQDYNEAIKQEKRETHAHKSHGHKTHAQSGGVFASTSIKERLLKVKPSEAGSAEPDKTLGGAPTRTR